MVGLGYRMARYTSKQRSIHRIPMMDPFQQQFEGKYVVLEAYGFRSYNGCASRWYWFWYDL